ncbi:MAG: RHS repeat-associated core domain-containing protein, partial [Litorimonas sp.]
MKNTFKKALALSTFTAINLSSFQGIAHAQGNDNSLTVDGTTFTYGQNVVSPSLTVQDARGVTTHYEYNQRGQIIEEQSAERGSIQYEYDEYGNVVEQRNEGGLIFKRKYDDQNRLTREVMKERGIDRKVTRYNYDNCDNGLGRLCAVNADGNITRYDYNPDGNYTRVATRHNGEDSFETTRYFYNEAGGLDRMHYPTGLVVSYHYADDGFVNRIIGRYETGEDKARFIIANNIRINPETGGLTTLKFGNGLKLKQQFNQDNILANSELFKGSNRLDSFAYTRDDAVNITHIDRLNDENDTRYSYDDNQRLITEDIGSNIATQRSTSYGYDAVNNRIRYESDNGSRAYTYAPTSNRLDKIGRKSFSYDERGNLLEDRDGKRRFEYDVTNRMNAFYKDGELKASYDYNARGQRIRKTLHNVKGNEDRYKTLHFAYAPSGELLSEFGRNNDKSNRFARDYVWFGNVPIAQIERKVRPDGTTRKAKISYLHTDHLGAPYSASDEDGKIVWQWNHDAYGHGKANRDVDGNGDDTVVRLRFTGQYHDRDSQLFYNHFRDYDPKLGRYIQSDPIGLQGGINRYAYVSGNPVNYVDPKGLSRIRTPLLCWPVSDGVSCQKLPTNTSSIQLDTSSDDSFGGGGPGFNDYEFGGGFNELSDRIVCFGVEAAIAATTNELLAARELLRRAARELGNTTFN